MHKVLWLIQTCLNADVEPSQPQMVAPWAMLLSCNPLPIDRFFELLGAWGKALKDYGLKPFDFEDYIGSYFVEECARSHLMVRFLVALGFQPHICSPEAGILKVRCGPLMHLLIFIGSRRHVYVPSFGDLHSYNPKSVKNIIENLSSLIIFRANIHEIIPATGLLRTGEDKNLPPAITTPSMYALSEGMNSIWEDALRRSGYDPGEVYAEDERRVREFTQRQGGSSSAMEVEGEDDQQKRILRRRRPGVRTARAEE